MQYNYLGEIMKIDFDFAIMYCRQIKQKLQNEITLILKNYGLTCPQGYFLNLFSYHTMLTLSEITYLLDVDKAYTTRIVNSLLQKGLVDKTENIRKYSIFLTEQGRKILKLIANDVKKNREKLLNGIDEEELNNFKNTLKKIINNLEV